MSYLAGIHVHSTGRKRSKPVNHSASDHESTVIKSVGIHSKQSSVVTEGGSDSGNNKVNESFPIKCFVMSIKLERPWNPRITQSYWGSSLSLHSRSWIPSAHRGRNPVWSHPNSCGHATFWSCGLRQFTHSFKKHLLSWCFEPGSVPGAGNKILNKVKDLPV